MKVKDLIGKLEDFNREADVSVVALCKKFPFTLSYGESEGVTKDSAESVSFYVDKLCSNENIKVIRKEETDIEKTDTIEFTVEVSNVDGKDGDELLKTAFEDFLSKFEDTFVYPVRDYNRVVFKTIDIDGSTPNKERVVYDSHDLYCAFCGEETYFYSEEVHLPLCAEHFREVFLKIEDETVELEPDMSELFEKVRDWDRFDKSTNASELIDGKKWTCDDRYSTSSNEKHGYS